MKVATALPCRREHQNQALEGNAAWLFIFMCIFRFMVCFIHLLHNFVTFNGFVYTFGLHCRYGLAVSSTSVFRQFLNQNSTTNSKSGQYLWRNPEGARGTWRRSHKGAWKTNQGGGIAEGAYGRQLRSICKLMEQDSWRRNHRGMTEEEARKRNHGGGTWEASGEPGKAFRGIWKVTDSAQWLCPAAGWCDKLLFIYLCIHIYIHKSMQKSLSVPPGS